MYHHMYQLAHMAREFDEQYGGGAGANGARGGGGAHAANGQATPPARARSEAVEARVWDGLVAGEPAAAVAADAHAGHHSARGDAPDAAAPAVHAAADATARAATAPPLFAVHDGAPSRDASGPIGDPSDGDNAVTSALHGLCSHALDDAVEQDGQAVGSTAPPTTEAAGLAVVQQDGVAATPSQAGTSHGASAGYAELFSSAPDRDADELDPADAAQGEQRVECDVPDDTANNDDMHARQRDEELAA
jgi:hypothetical protein